jgi:hypothetical protein
LLGRRHEDRERLRYLARVDTVRGHLRRGPGRDTFSPLQRMPLNSSNEGSNRVSMTWRSISVCP